MEARWILWGTGWLHLVLNEGWNGSVGKELGIEVSGIVKGFVGFEFWSCSWC